VTDIVFSAVLDESYRENLENLLFFNPNQEKTIAIVAEGIRRYGKPSIATVGGRLSVALEALSGAETLFAFDNFWPKPQLIGLIVYAREGDDTLAIPYVAVHKDFARGGPKAKEFLFMRLIDQVCEIGRSIEGVTSLGLITTAGKVQYLRIS